MPKTQHHHPGHEGKGFHDRRHTSSERKPLTPAQIKHQRKMAAEKQQEALERAMPHALRILERQRVAVAELTARLKEKYGSQKVIKAQIAQLDAKMKSLSKQGGLTTRKKLDSYHSARKKRKDLDVIRKRMADEEKRLREINKTLAEHHPHK